MTFLGSVDIPFTKSTKIAVDATDTAGQAATVAQQATDTAGQAQATAQTASQTATQAAATAADAAQAAQTAITTANGKNKAYYGATTPTSPKSGDIWFVEDGNNNVTAIKHYDGTQWVTDVNNTELAQQISAAQAAADNAVTVGQAAQQTAADAEAKGDAAAKTAEEAKDAATKAQADAASAVTSANNAVDTANNAKQVASDAATQASAAKTNAQTAMSNAQDAINKANAANANANTREKSIIKSNTAPSNPATDQLWIDTSKTPQIMRRWNGSTWVDLSPTQASQIGAVSTTTYTTDITNINNTLSQKASVTTVNTLSGRVDSAETAITQNANDIALKADKNVVDTLKNTVDNHSTLISQNADAIALKANASTVDTLTGRVSTAEATLKTQANEIAARITKTDADAKYATQTALTATATSLTSSISAVQTNLDNLKIGGRNLIKNSDFSSEMKYWNSNLNTNGTISFLTNKFQGHNAIQISASSGYAEITQVIDNIEASTDYTFSGNLGGAVKIFFIEKKSDGNNTAVYSDNYHYYPAQNYEELTPRISFTFKTQPDTAKLIMFFRVEKKETNPSTYGRGTLLKLEKGNKATDWTPAPEDMATQSQISQLVDDINLRVQKGDVINQINVSTEGILIDGKKVHITGQTTIDNAVIKDAMIQSMTANKLTAGTIDANVITVKNINASNIVTGTLDASKATVANIDASKITTGTLNAARIAVGSIDASKLNVSSLSALSANLGSVTAGNISGVNINIGNGNFTVDTAGNLIARNANITGTINATSGTFSGSLNGATGTFKGSISTPMLTVQADKIENYSSFGLQLQTAQWQPSETKPFVNNGFVVFNTLNSGLEIYHTDLNGNSDTLHGVSIDAKDFNVYGNIIGNTMQANNILLNGAHSIISRDGGQLYFTDSGGSRIDVTVRQVHADQWLMPNNMKIGYHTIQTNDNGEIWFNGANGSFINIKVATLHYTGSLSKSSSESIKTNIEPISFSALDEIMKTDFYKYNYISDLEKGVTKPSFGPVIGDSYRLSDKFLTQDAKSIAIDSMTAINSQAIKELYEAMQGKNQDLLLKIADLEARLAKLEA